MKREGLDVSDKRPFLSPGNHPKVRVRPQRDFVLWSEAVGGPTLHRFAHAEKVGNNIALYYKCEVSGEIRQFGFFSAALFQLGECDA